MAGWRESERICRHRFVPESRVGLIFIAICMSVPTSYAQEGFLSIDCGYTGSNYIENNLTWTADYGTYISTGDSYAQPPLIASDGDELYTNGSGPYYIQRSLNSSDGSRQSLQSFRFFPEPRNKYCYELPTPGSYYLIRASFYMNGTTLNDTGPFQFILFLDASNWFTLTSGDGSLPYLLAIEEAFFHPTNNITNFCLQPVLNVPFISSLELRQLNDTMYSYSGSDKEYLALLFRYNLGTPTSTYAVRFPDDKFDRIWATLTWNEGALSVPTPSNNTTKEDVYYVPPKVMQDGWSRAYAGSGPAIIFSVYSNYLPVYLTPAESMVAVAYAINLNNSDSQVDNVQVSIDANNYRLNISNQPSMLAIPNFTLMSNSMHINIGDSSTMNAVELYGRYNYNVSRTRAEDVAVITALKTSINLTDWQGDPCTPVPHDWLSCAGGYDLEQNFKYHFVEQPCDSNTNTVKYCAQEYFSGGNFSITALNLSKVTNEGISLFLDFANTSSGTLLDLQTLIINNSTIDNATLQLIFDNVLQFNSNFSVLDLRYNSLESVPGDWHNVFHLTSMNLSHNNISGEMSTFDSATALENLDLSYNSISYLPSNWTRGINSNSLVFLDLSHNQIEGEISSLDSLVQINSGSLQELHISNNNLRGTFSSSIYFSGLPQLTTANFDQNSIQGVLNLSTWYEALQMVAYGNASTSIVTRQLFSFVNNSIVDIIPDAKTIESTMDILMEKNSSFQHKGILLGGNPYCENAKSYIPKYLCPAVNNKTQSNKRKSYTALIVGICGGILAMLLSSVTSATLWQLWKQLHTLRAVEKALADKKVQPPFYHYNDLKLATRGFHKDNKLGQGGFGIVYKGVLADGMKLAVKKLLSSRGLQVLNDLDEFLNEVMLITGIKHRNLVQLKGCCIKDNERLLVYEYVEKGNLAQALWGSKPYGGLDWEQRFNICVGIARGLAYLHEELQPSIMHRDIKPENILLDDNFKPKIADFGLARYFTNEESHAHFTANIAGTLGYFSPEYASQGQLSEKADVYSYGVVVLEIISGRKCIDHSLPSEEVYLKDWVRNMHNKGSLFDVLEQELTDHCVGADAIRAINIGLLCVQDSPESRPTMSEIVTMFSGHTDVKIVMDEFHNVDHDLKDLYASINNDLEHPTLPSIQEESVDSILFDNHQFSSRDVSGII